MSPDTVPSVKHARPEVSSEFGCMADIARCGVERQLWAINARAATFLPTTGMRPDSCRFKHEPRQRQTTPKHCGKHAETRFQCTRFAPRDAQLFEKKISPSSPSSERRQTGDLPYSFYSLFWTTTHPLSYWTDWIVVELNQSRRPRKPHDSAHFANLCVTSAAGKIATTTAIAR